MHHHPDLFRLPQGVELDADRGIVVIRYPCGDGVGLTPQQAQWQLEELRRFGSQLYEALWLLGIQRAQFAAEAQAEIDELSAEFRRRMENDATD